MSRVMRLSTRGCWIFFKTTVVNSRGCAPARRSTWMKPAALHIRALNKVEVEGNVERAGALWSHRRPGNDEPGTASAGHLGGAGRQAPRAVLPQTLQCARSRGLGEVVRSPPVIVDDRGYRLSMSERGVLREVNEVIRALNWLFGAAVTEEVHVSRESYRCSPLFHRIFACAQGFAPLFGTSLLECTVFSVASRQSLGCWIQRPFWAELGLISDGVCPDQSAHMDAHSWIAPVLAPLVCARILFCKGVVFHFRSSSRTSFVRASCDLRFNPTGVLFVFRAQRKCDAAIDVGCLKGQHTFSLPAGGIWART